MFSARVELFKYAIITIICLPNFKPFIVTDHTAILESKLLNIQYLNFNMQEKDKCISTTEA